MPIGIYIYICMYVYIYIYIYRERERERDIDMYMYDGLGNYTDNQRQAAPPEHPRDLVAPRQTVVGPLRKPRFRLQKAAGAPLELRRL